MPARTPVSAALHDAFETHFLKLLGPLGFTPTKPAHLRPGIVAVLASRPLGGGRRLELDLWCDGGTGANLRVRFNVVEPMQGQECWRSIDLEVPWPEPGMPRLRTLEFAANELHVGGDASRLAMAVEFLAGTLAANAERLAVAAPEVASLFRAASAEPVWREAVSRAAALWKARHVHGSIDDRSSPATIVFVGAKLVTVEAEGVRLTFRIDASRFDRTLPVTVSGWFHRPGGTRAATRLTNGTTTWQFDPEGQLVAVE